jgi:hypothetical protein
MSQHPQSAVRREIIKHEIGPHSASVLTLFDQA